VTTPPSRVTPPATGRSAFLVAIGILASRLTGLIRQRVFAHFFGLSSTADAFAAAFRIPNVLQNLFGEGALSASFIPVYASLRARGEYRDATRVAGAVAALLGLATSAIVLLGVLTTPWFIDLIAPGFHGETRALTIVLVRILFPGAGLLVTSAWCLGILNSHHKFLLSYTAPVLWNAAMIGTLLIFGPHSTQPELAVTLAWGSVVGSALQFLVQLPLVFRLVPDLRLALDTTSEHVRTVVRNFGPAFVSRGVVQISAFIDVLIATLLPAGAVAGLANAQTLYTLPVSLFGMSVSAAELPTMSGVAGREDLSALRDRLNAGLRQIAYFVVPSALAFLCLGDVIAGALLQTGEFTHANAVYVWGILAGSAVGLLASTLGRLYASTYYALRDTRTPLRYAVIRVVTTTVFGYVSAIILPPALGIDPGWGAAGLTASAGVSGWIEFVMLRRTLNVRLGRTGLPASLVARLWIAAAAGAAIGWLVKIEVPTERPILLAAAVLIPYGVVYLGMTAALGVAEAQTAWRRVRKRIPGFDDS
jgi:putative peptidoglycan lipid II flippase